MRVTGPDCGRSVVQSVRKRLMLPGEGLSQGLSKAIGLPNNLRDFRCKNCALGLPGFRWARQAVRFCNVLCDSGQVRLTPLPWECCAWPFSLAEACRRGRKRHGAGTDSTEGGAANRIQWTLTNLPILSCRSHPPHRPLVPEIRGRTIAL